MALVVDDEVDIARLLELSLGCAGFETVAAYDGSTALRLTRERAPDLVLLDWSLPDVQGTDVCRQLKRDAGTRRIPILFVTARASESDRVQAFEAGADDYILKPFSVRELALRCHAMLRKTASTAAAPLRWGSIELEPARARCSVGGEQVTLTALELKLLADLLSGGGRLRSHQELLGSAWNLEGRAQGRAGRLQVNRLRKKLEQLRKKLERAGNWLETVRGHGYRLAPRG